MDTMNLNFSSNFLWEIKRLGKYLEISDVEFLVIFEPNNGKAARVIKQNETINVIRLYVANYNPLELWEEIGNPGLDEPGALSILKQMKGE